MQKYMCNVCGKLHSLFNDAALCHPDVITKEVEDLPARVAEHRNEAEKGGAEVKAKMMNCGNCGVPRFVHGGILEACPNCGDDETELLLIDEFP